MGLDMYLDAKRYLYGSEKATSKNGKIRNKIRAMFKEIKTTGNLDYVKVSFEVGYWRKANEIHAWFVKNCQDGTDDCGYYGVDREKLAELKEICVKILANPKLAKELLPTQEGFFFGGTEYDEWYTQDLEKTIKIIDYVLSLPKEFELEYHSSW